MRSILSPPDVHPDPARASLLPPHAYADPDVYRALCERAFAQSWHLVGPLPRTPRSATPFTLLPGCLDEPLLATVDEAGVRRVVSNVCTHRCALLCEEPQAGAALVCRYHGRRFGLDGRFRSHKGFEGALDFPSPADDLAVVAHVEEGPLDFVHLGPAPDFAPIAQALRAHLGPDLGAPGAVWSEVGGSAKSYDVEGNWMLWVDNYLEGFHIPTVHPALSRQLDPAVYRSELFSGGSVQLGYPRAGEGKSSGEISAFYFWIFPATVINVYGWGISVNVVEPTGPTTCRVRYRRLVRDATQLAVGPGSDLHTVELEDDAMVASVARGVRARLARRGRYAPAHEAGVHHFHRMVAALLA